MNTSNIYSSDVSSLECSLILMKSRRDYMMTHFDQYASEIPCLLTKIAETDFQLRKYQKEILLDEGVTTI